MSDRARRVGGAGLALVVLFMAGCAASAADEPAIVEPAKEGARLAWRAQVAGPRDYVLPAAAGSTLIIATGPTSEDGPSRGRVVGMDAITGAHRWTVDLGAAPFIPIARGGTVYLGVADGTVVAMDAVDGAIRWRKAVSLLPVRVIADDESVYAAAAQTEQYLFDTIPVDERLLPDGQVVSLDAGTGEERWRFRQPGPSRATSTYLGLGEGRLFVAATDVGTVKTTGLWALDPDDGRVAWRAPAVAPSSPIAVRKGVLFVQSRAGLEARSTEDGRLRWRRSGSYAFWPAVAGESVYVGPVAHQLEAIDAANGRLRWKAFVGEKNLVPLVRSGVVYVATFAARGTVQARNARTGALVWRVRLSADALALGSDRLYAGGETGRLFALRLGR